MAKATEEPVSETGRVVSRILVVEDDPGMGELLREELEEEGHEVMHAGSVEEARPLLEGEAVDLVVSDLRLPGAGGEELLAWVRESLDPPPAFITITAFGSVRQAVEALKAGADDFLTKPLDLDHLRLSAERALENRRLRLDVRRFRALLADDDFHGMVGRSRAMRRLFGEIERVARAPGPVLVSGESGTGKELVARAIHAESPRSDGPFLAVNCAGIPADLLESEFFGHAEGAFTGATGDRKGLFLESEGGTILLDEIAEMPVELQAKLLRVLEEGRIRPVGSDVDLPADVRVVAATNRDLERAMEKGTFRKDLYFRLETYRLRVPPLRERGEDVELLAAHFLRRAAARAEKEVETISPGLLELLRNYPFPGNVRELENAVVRAVTFCDGSELRIEHLPERIRDRRKKMGSGGAGARGAGEDVEGSPPDLRAASLLEGSELPSLDEVERRYILRVLESVGGNKRRAAALLGIGRRTLYRRLESYGEGAKAEDDGEEGTEEAG